MKKISGIPPQHTKLRGEVAELRFMTRAAELGLRVHKPWGDSSRYDFIVETGGRFLRIQVKSSSCHRQNLYICPIGRSRQKRYTTDEIDFFAINIVPTGTWYIIPVQVVCKVKFAVSLSPNNPLSKLAIYKEAWHLLCEEPGKARNK